MSKKKHEWTRKGVTASMAVVLAFGMVPMAPGVAFAKGEGAVQPDRTPVEQAQESCEVQTAEELINALERATPGDEIVVANTITIDANQTIEGVDGVVLVPKAGVSYDAENTPAMFCLNNGSILKNVEVSLDGWTGGQLNVAYMKSGSTMTGCTMIGAQGEGDAPVTRGAIVPTQAQHVTISGNSFCNFFASAYVNDTTDDDNPDTKSIISGNNSIGCLNDWCIAWEAKDIDISQNTGNSVMKFFNGGFGGTKEINFSAVSAANPKSKIFVSLTASTETQCGTGALLQNGAYQVGGSVKNEDFEYGLNLEDALSLAQNNDVIELTQTSYQFDSTLSINEGVTIKAANSESKPVLSFGDGYVAIGADGVKLQGLTIDVSNANTTNIGILNQGGTNGESSYELTLEDCVIKGMKTNDNSKNGGTHGLSLKGGSLTRLSNVAFEDCYAGVTVKDRNNESDTGNALKAYVVLDGQPTFKSCTHEYQLFNGSHYFPTWDEMMDGDLKNRAKQVFIEKSAIEPQVREDGNAGGIESFDYDGEYTKAGLSWVSDAGVFQYAVNEDAVKSYIEASDSEKAQLAHGSNMYMGIVFPSPVEGAQAVKVSINGGDWQKCDLIAGNGDNVLNGELIEYFNFADLDTGAYPGDASYEIEIEWYKDAGCTQLAAAGSAVVQRSKFQAPTPSIPGGGSATAPSEPEGEVTENADGSTTTIVTEDDGSSVETTVSEDEGVTTVVEKDKDGAVTSVSATVTDEAVEAAGGEAVVLPFVEPIEAASSDEAVAVKVSAPAGAKVAVPVAKAEGADAVAPGVVLVLVDSEGAETVLPKTANDGSSLSAAVPGDCTLKVVDASADFPDVASEDWYEEQGVADFVSARGIMTGVETEPGSFEFQGDAPTDRGMFVTMLHRLESEPEAAGSEGFGDVPEGSWYAGSSAWAVEAGIATGYENADGSFAFEGDGAVTREQMATFLYRYAQWLGMDTSARADREIEGVSDWAKDALSWAVAEGLIKGDDDTGAIRPADGATRAEAAVVVMRMIGLMA